MHSNICDSNQNLSSGLAGTAKIHFRALPVDARIQTRMSCIRTEKMLQLSEKNKYEKLMATTCLLVEKLHHNLRNKDCHEGTPRLVPTKETAILSLIM